MFEFILVLTAVFAAGVASIAGFGIGSLITPLLSVAVDTKLAIALVSIPHFVATALRFWMLRAHLDKKVLFSFGLMSAAGGALGAFLHSTLATPALTLIFGVILIFTGFMGATEYSQKLLFKGFMAWIAGGASGFLGGLVGNQGGIRSGALLGFQISKESFVATATAIGLIVDIARMPIYLWSFHDKLMENLNWIAITCVGVVIGTLLGGRLLRQLPERVFRRLVSALIFILGVAMVAQGF